MHEAGHNLMLSNTGSQLRFLEASFIQSLVLLVYFSVLVPLFRSVYFFYLSIFVHFKIKT